MKVSEMNQRERKAFYNIKHAANDLLGGLENTLLDYGQDDPEYKSAKAHLADHEGLVAELYGMATTAIYGEGYCCFNPTTVQKELRDINFCGKAWLMERCEKRITKMLLERKESTIKTMNHFLQKTMRKHFLLRI